jgi:hypothetical protein
MISKTGEAETITTHYLFFLGLYRALYLVNWIWRFYFEGFFDLIAVVAGVVQTILYCDFFYLYITKGMLGLCWRFPQSHALLGAFLPSSLAPHLPISYSPQKELASVKLFLPCWGSNPGPCIFIHMQIVHKVVGN